MTLDLELVRNIGIIAHIDAGKTTTTERILYYTGREYRLGSVDDGNTTTDFIPEEQERGITIKAAAVTTFWELENKKYQINIIDTPGHVDFTAEVERSLRALDGAIGVFCARSGVEAQSETVWRQAQRYKVPRIAFINKMDRAGANFEKVVSAIRTRLKSVPLVIELPVGAEDDFDGTIDLITMKWLSYKKQEDGKVVVENDIPANLVEEAQIQRELMLDELASHSSDEFAEACLDGAPTADQIYKALREAVLANSLVPVLCGASLRNMGVQPLIDAVCRYLPSPLDLPPVTGRDPDDDSKVLTRSTKTTEPASALAFKTVCDEFKDYTFLRVYSGDIERGQSVMNTRTGKRERLNQLGRIYADKFEPVDKLEAGDIGAVIGLRDTVTGDTLCDDKHQIVLERIKFPEPVVAVKIEPKTSADRTRLETVLSKMSKEDPTFITKIDPDTGETIISGMGELHLQVTLDRMLREFKVGADVGKPSVAFKESIFAKIEEEAIFERETTTKNLYAGIRVRLDHNEDVVQPTVVMGDVPPDQIPKNFLPAVKRAVEAALSGGGRAGFPMIHIKATVLGGKYRPEESTDVAYEAAAAMAVNRAINEGKMHLLWPIMKFDIQTPEDYFGPISSDLNGRRALIEHTETLEGMTRITGLVPISEMFGYANAIRGLSQGRAGYSLEIAKYDRTPPEVEAKYYL
ncbi:MAG: elongation factor G [Planctomycetes bacterium]|nr:elongation factor G [Planctomycetota bacterium]